MKTIKIIIMLLLANSLFGQNYPVLTTTSLAGNPRNDINYAETGNYAIDTSNERDQYVGLWRYEGNGMIFDLKIEKVDKYRIGEGQYYRFSDMVILRYRVVQNGVELYNNMNATIYYENYLKSSGSKDGSVNYLSGQILDVTRNVSCSYFIVKSSTNPEKIKFDIMDGECSKGYAKSFYNDDRPLLDIPIYEVEMVKIE
jgi:hypothetical protein